MNGVHSLFLGMDCVACKKVVSFDACVQLLPCLHSVCTKCFEMLSKTSKICPCRFCFSLLRLRPDVRLTKCDSPRCHRRLSIICEPYILECEHALCPECFSELPRGRTTCVCPDCDTPVAGEGEDMCEVCGKFLSIEKLSTSLCCVVKLCPDCVETGRTDRLQKKNQKASKEEEAEGPRCPVGKCPPPKKRKKRRSAVSRITFIPEEQVQQDKEKTGVFPCTASLMCQNDVLANFPNTNECEHEVCLECIWKMIEANEGQMLVPCCPNDMCKNPYRSDSVLSLKLFFPEKKSYFDQFLLGYDYGFAKLQDETALEMKIDANFDVAHRLVTVTVANTSDDDGTYVKVEFDRKGTLGDLVREARRALKIQVTDKVYGYMLRYESGDKPIVLCPDSIHQASPSTPLITTHFMQEVESAGILKAQRLLVDTTGIVAQKN